MHTYYDAKTAFLKISTEQNGGWVCLCVLFAYGTQWLILVATLMTAEPVGNTIGDMFG